MTCTFSTEQITALSAPLDRAKVRQREQGRSSVSYLEGWQRQTVALRCVNQSERTIGARGTSRDQKPGWGVTYTARVRVTVTAGGLVSLVREGSGAGHGIDVDLGQAHESALKEAETDAMKRALVTFGARFGLSLYDRNQRPMGGAAARPLGAGPQAPANGVVRRLPPSQAQPAPAGTAPDAPLDPPTIRSLHERIRGLLPPQLAAFSQAFRRAFQVPETTPSIAGLITEQRHRAWIQQYLAQGLGQAQARTA